MEVAFFTDDVAAACERAVAAGAVPVRAPGRMPWGQAVSCVRSIEGTHVAICSSAE